MAQTATWVWYPDEFEIWLHRQISYRRTERGTIVPVFWRLDTPYESVKFRKCYKLAEADTILIQVEGTLCIIMLDGQVIHGSPTNLVLPAGEHELEFSVVNPGGLPALYVAGNNLVSDATWEVSCGDKQWHAAGYENFTDPLQPPSAFKLATTPLEAVRQEQLAKSLLVDFGKETFGYLKLEDLQGQSHLLICYGESVEEALAVETCDTLDRLELDGTATTEYLLPQARAFRYVQLIPSGSLGIGKVSALYEYLPLNYKGSFRCSNPTLNQIWETALYTFHLNTREFFLDGIKRDRWVWSGDAYQSFLMNFYTFFEPAVTRRTLIALRGKDPVATHINHIMDYTLYWFLGLYDYYLYTGDLAFIRQTWFKALSLLDFCQLRTNAEGMLEGRPEDWVYLDWAEMDNRGEVCAEQILFCRSLECMAELSELLGEPERAVNLKAQSQTLKERILTSFWDAERGGLAHRRFKGRIDHPITRYANIFALLFGYLPTPQIEVVKSEVLLNPDVQAITTPYMRFYELDALCTIGEHNLVLDEIISYWGGMLELGATTFWEQYDPREQGQQHYAMYGRPFGRSLCHAWGASPLYLLGKHFLGVKPLSPGYADFIVEPQLGKLDWLEGVVPLPDGQVEIYLGNTVLKVTPSRGGGKLRFRSAVPPRTNRGNIETIEPGYYEIALNEPTQTYIVSLGQ
jgi:alpha-L-rhamnosidase